MFQGGGMQWTDSEPTEVLPTSPAKVRRFLPSGGIVVLIRSPNSPLSWVQTRGDNVAMSGVVLEAGHQQTFLAPDHGFRRPSTEI